MFAPPQQQQPQRPAQQPAWFGGAPVSKLMTIFKVVLYIFVRHNADTVQFDSQRMQRGDAYRYLSSKLTFLTPGELAVGTLTWIYLVRKYEREMGTRKFIVFYGIVLTLCIMQEFLMLDFIIYRNRVLDLDQPFRWTYAGMYGVIGALFTLFHTFAPRLHPRFISILGLQFSEKSLYYLWFFQLVSSGGVHTLIPTLAGTMAGILYLNTPLRKLQVPESIVRLSTPILDRLGFVDHHVAPLPQQQRAAAAAPVRPPAPRPEQQIPLPEPDPDAIEQLTTMGFPPAQVREALRQSHNNVEHAANRLIGGGSS